jgi:hypothetical protein
LGSVEGEWGQINATDHSNNIRRATVAFNS